MNVLHKSWLPPAPGRAPSMRVASGSDVLHRLLHARIALLSLRLQNTLVLVYVMRLPAAEQANRLGCAEATVRGRVLEAKRLLTMGHRASVGLVRVNANQ
jgi:DNA-directed RNA polymerase specialized sigma24 family protein